MYVFIQFFFFFNVDSIVKRNSFQWFEHNVTHVQTPSEEKMRSSALSCITTSSEEHTKLPKNVLIHENAEFLVLTFLVVLIVYCVHIHLNIHVWHPLMECFQNLSHLKVLVPLPILYLASLVMSHIFFFLSDNY